ncbi:hypothetical protein SteCoe_38564 [Stentor coeruleus]|uniref:Uncharacterized protein n=1 Tax=Stentor coeruleus TaxID=5963 RepID=A0A1R2ALK1_9CILI|nr:hypothetical protein SteCoe_38564 [Stentor coeruleus]
MYSSRSPRRIRTVPASVREEPRNVYLDKIRSRNKKSKFFANPMLASTVLKLYFLPYFSDLYKTKEDNLRKSRYGNRSHSKSPIKQKYVRLADILKASIVKAQYELQNLQKALENVNLAKSQILNEIHTQKSVTLLKTSHLHIMNYSKKVFQIWVRNKELSRSSIQAKLLKYKEKSLNNKAKLMNLQKVHSDEKSSNEILKNKSQQYRHWYFLYQMISQLSGESLKGVFYSIDGLVNETNLEGKLKMIHNSTKIANNLLTQKLELFIINTVFASRQKSSYIEKSNQNAKYRQNIYKQLKSLKSSLIEHMDNMTSALKTSETDCETLFLSTKSKEKEIIDFSLEYEGMQEKLREAQAKQQSIKRELLCKLCNKVYYETENYNWSCSVHISQWSGAVYWCCGATNKDSIGCQKRRHEERKDEETEESLIFGFLSKEKDILKYCSNCRQTGHNSHECIYDPNSYNGMNRTRKHKIRVRNLNQNIAKKLREIKGSKSYRENFQDIDSIKTVLSTSVSPDISVISDGGISNRSGISARSGTPTFRGLR